MSAIIATVITNLVSALGGWLIRHFQEIAKDNAQKAADEAAAKKAVDDDKAAVTPAERDNAAKGIAENL